MSRARTVAAQPSHAIGRQFAPAIYSLHTHDSNLAMCWAKDGDTERARAALAGFLQDPKALPMHAARLHAVLGDDEEAIDWLEKAVAWRSLIFFSVDPDFHHLHRHPRFRALAGRLGFPVLEDNQNR